MGLREQFTEQLKTSMKAGDAARTSTLRMILARLKDVDIAARPKGIDRVPDEEVIAHLLPVRGIGRWTAEMFLIFALGRLDVLPVADYGLRAGVQRHYGLAEVPKVPHLLELAEPWRPYRSVATWFFWRSFGFVPQSEAEAT